MLGSFLLGFVSVGAFVGLALVGLAFNAFGFHLHGLASFDWKLGAAVTLGAGAVGGLVSMVREIIASRRPLVGHVVGEHSDEDWITKLWDWFPW